MRYLALLTILFNLNLTFGQTKLSSDQYISMYKDYAIYEMYSSGVPASITLAQGILESQNGNSRLATEANNHFGIKCKSDWTGKTITADDDAEGECFRAYESAAESFKDHSNFLKENWRYNECFKYERTDYERWAEGLKKAGYATNPKYSTLLIGIIDRYNLHQYDLAPVPVGMRQEDIFNNNGVPAVYAQEGETMDIIAEKNDMRAKRIYKYNDLPNGTKIEQGDIIYLKPKRRKGSAPYHIVNEGELMRDVSQLYGIKLKHLYKKNHMQAGDEAIAGSKLNLQKKAAEKPKLAKKEGDPSVQPKKEVLDRNPHAKISDEEIQNNKKQGYHVIKSGDNLYRVSEIYHVFVEDLIEWNGISSSSQLKVGDKVYLSSESANLALKSKSSNPKKETPKSNSDSKVHIVNKGETAYKICREYAITTDQLIQWNHMKDAASIYVGQKLKVGE